MNDSHARLQRALRAIERGERLEAIDALLIRDVLQQPPHFPNDKLSETVEPTDVRGSDAYRVLLQLRRQRQLKAAEAAGTPPKAPSPVKPPVPASSPEKNEKHKNKHLSPRATVYVDKTTEDRQQLQREEALKLRQEAGKVDAYRAEMAVSLAATQRQLERSQRDAAEAAQEMEALLAASQRVLSSSFLFERNLTEFCHERSLEVITGVLQRFQHRFYALVFARWVDHTAQLRRVEQRRAAATLVRVVRGHQARRLRRVLAREVATLEHQARQVVELRVTYRHHQALKLQRVWRRYQWKQHDAARHRRKLAVLYLQQRWRDRKLRRNAQVAALINVKQIRAAIRVQCLARGWLTRRTLARQERERRRQAAAMALLARNASCEAMVRWQLARRGAAFVITRAMYPMLVRERFRRLAALLKRQRAARVVAVNVASWYKRSGKYHERQRASAADKLRTLLQQEQARQHVASVQIQRTMRRWWYQQQYETQRRRRVKLARLARLRDKQARLARKPEDRGGRGAAVAAAAASLAKASAGLADVLARQVRKKAPSAQPQAVDVPTAAASKIQCAFLRHRHGVHARLQRWRRQAMDVEKRVRTRRRAAITIQRHTRGMLARRVLREMRARHLLWEHISRWKWRRASRRARAARRILRWLRGKRSQRLDELWTLERQRRAAMATRLQRWLRRTFFYRKRVATLLAAHRRRHEALLMATQSLVICSQHFTDDLVLQSKRAQAFDENIRLYVKGLTTASTTTALLKPPARARFPLLPLVFLAVSGLKDPAKWGSVDSKELLLAKVERAKMVALFKAVNKLPTTAHHSAQRRHHHKPSDTFAMTDVDLAMAKAAGASKSALLFPEFAETLQHLADLKLAHVVLWWSKFDGAEARLLALLWQFVLRVAELAPLVDLLNKYVERVLGAHARVIQRLFLRQRDRAHGRLLRLQQQQQREVERRRAAIIKVQAHARRLLARGIYRARLQAQYDKYIDPEWGLPYWLNPRTGFSTWRKPWALGDLDVAREAVPFPPADKTLTVGCQGERDCARCSDWYCYVCDEFFCGECEPTFHKKKDGDHAMERLRKCGLCQFQVASRRCDGCADAVEKKKQNEKKESKKKPTTITETEPPQDQEEDDDVSALYCDVCFAFAHRRGALQVHKSTPLVELCVDCQNDDALLGAPKALDTPKPAPRVVQWACAADGKRVCGVCAWSLHPVEACGELTRVPLVTIRMREHAELLKRGKEARDRADTELIRQRELRVRQERAAKKIQTFWRNCAPLIRARRVARALRAEKDAVWKQHQVDALEQKTLKYRVRNALGMAHALPSDSAAQRKLREMNALQRRQMGLRARAFGLLLPEYMQLGVPLPGVARVAVGTKFIESSEDLRGWVLNRQTIRLKKLPPKEQRDRARRLRFRHQEPPLEDRAWLHELELWMRDPTDTLLVDVDATQRITEHNIPLAAAFTTAGKAPAAPTKPTKRGAAPVVPKVGEPEEYAMFLVEFSMDPTRVVWVSHSLAERFTVWRKQKMREYRERSSLQHKTQNDDGSAVPSPVLLLLPAPAASANEEAVTQNQAMDPAQYTQEYPADTGYASPDPNAAAWGAYTGYGGYDYSSYYGQTAWAGTASDPWTQYNTYNQSPTASTDASAHYYDYANAASEASYASTFPAATAEYTAAPMVDSSNYFYAEDGNAAAWQAYYASHPEVAPSYDYSTPSGDASAYAGYDAAAYMAPDAWGSYGGNPYADPSAAYTSTTDTAGYYAPQPTQASAWEEVFDPATQQTYYYNRETQETSWAYPS